MISCASLFVRRGVGAVTLCALMVSSVSGFAAEKPKAKAMEMPKGTPAYYGAQPATEQLNLDMYARIREEGFGRSHVMEIASSLVDGIGPRLTGSPNMEKANNWTMNTLKGFGLQNAHLEDWGEFGMGWKQVNSWARMVTPDTEPIWLQVAPWSPATNGAVTGDVVVVEADSEADLKKYDGKLAGKIVLFGAMRAVPDITEPMFKRYTEAELKEMTGPEEESARRGLPANMTREQFMAERMRIARVRTAAMKMMKEQGVAAILTPSRDGGNGGGTMVVFDDNGANLTRNAQLRENAVPIPNAVLTIEGYGRLYRLYKAHVPVKLEVNLQTEFSGDHVHGFNTVAEIPGEGKMKDEIVMVGGHLDSWISGTGATDNAAGSVVAMEAVRILKALNYQPKRTIRIALWSGEEQGLFGSRAYVKQHFGEFEEKPAAPGADPMIAMMRGPQGPLHVTKEWEKLDAYYNLDNGTGRIRGIYAQGNYAIGPIFQQWLAPLADLGAATVTYRNTGSTDHVGFDAVGLPGFQFIQDPMDYFSRTHHSSADTYERLHEKDLQQAAVIEAIFIYNTCEREAMMPRKAFPHPETERERAKPLQLFPNAVMEPEPNKPGAPMAR